MSQTAADPSAESSPPGRWLSRDMVVVSLTALATQGITALSQFVFAALFGASLATDAFFAAIAAPMYVTSVTAATLLVVFVPIYIERRTTMGPSDADGLARGATNVMTLLLLAIATVGILGSDAIIGWTAPGLPEAGRALARGLAVILWPSIVGAGVVALLTARWQVDERFGWPAAVPVIGALLNLALIVTLASSIGVTGAAVGWTVAFVVQAVLLARVIAPTWQPSLELRHPAMRTLFANVAPLAFAAIFIRASTILERYLGSELATGQLSHLTYASRIVAVLGLLASAGPAAVLLPRMAGDVTALDFGGLRARASGGLRALWILVAPALALLVAVADPAVRLAFEHGAFTRADSDAVAALVRIYAPSVVAVGLASITGRAIYALKAIRVLAIAGAIEGLAYIAYTTFLAHRFGAEGVALGFSIYFLGSVTWQLLYLRHVLAARGGRVARSFVVTTALAAVAGVGAWLASQPFDTPIVGVVAGTVVCAAVYVSGLALARARGLIAR